MTGRELIVYILRNGLENEQVFKDGKLLGFITAGEAAEKLNVGLETINVYFLMGWIEGVTINGSLYIRADVESPVQQNAL